MDRISYFSRVLTIPMHLSINKFNVIERLMMGFVMSGKRVAVCPRSPFYYLCVRAEKLGMPSGDVGWVLDSFAVSGFWNRASNQAWRSLLAAFSLVVEIQSKCFVLTHHLKCGCNCYIQNYNGTSCYQYEWLQARFWD